MRRSDDFARWWGQVGPWQAIGIGFGSGVVIGLFILGIGAWVFL